MKKEFIPYEESLALRELGFDEECFCTMYTDIPFNKKNGNPIKLLQIGCGDKDTDTVKLSETQKFANSQYADYYIAVPLYQQVFRWFLEKYNLLSITIPDGLNPGLWAYRIESLDKSIVLEKYVDQSYWTMGTCFKTPEEATLASIQKLIEICKTIKPCTKK